MKISADGFIDVRDHSRIRTPGMHSEKVSPPPQGEALSFLLSHSFPGHRRMVRGLTSSERKQVRLARWARSVQERMALVDRIWRAVSEPVLPPRSNEPEFLQVVECEGWAFPIYLDGASTRVIPEGGVPAGEISRDRILRLETSAA